jgi:hypothetical protein
MWIKLPNGTLVIDVDLLKGLLQAFGSWIDDNQFALRLPHSERIGADMVLREGFRNLFLDLLLQITYDIVNSGFNLEHIFVGMEVVVNKKEPDFPDELW